MAFGIDGKLDLGLKLSDFMPNQTNTSGTRTTQKLLSQEATDKIIYDVMSSDKGLAALASAENLTGGSNSSSKTLLAQDLVTKLVGEIAAVTAETVETSSSQSQQKKKPTVICTELNRQGILPDNMYRAGEAFNLNMHPATYEGYIVWAKHVVPLMQKSTALSLALSPIVHSRYLMTTGAEKFTFLGAVTIYIGQPVCNILGRILRVVNAMKAGVKYGQRAA